MLSLIILSHDHSYIDFYLVQTKISTKILHRNALHYLLSLISFKKIYIPFYEKEEFRQPRFFHSYEVNIMLINAMHHGIGDVNFDADSKPLISNCSASSCYYLLHSICSQSFWHRLYLLQKIRSQTNSY